MRAKEDNFNCQAVSCQRLILFSLGGMLSDKELKLLTFQLNLVESFCVPPVARHSRLSSCALQLLRSGDGADMLFEVVTAPGGSPKPFPCQVDLDLVSQTIPAFLFMMTRFKTNKHKANNSN